MSGGQLFGDPPGAGPPPVRADAPLAAPLRPRAPDEAAGQPPLVGPGAPPPRTDP